MYHIPVCPFSQRVEILLNLKDRAHDVDYHVVDITKPREDWLLEKTRGVTALPALDVGDGRTILESLVILQYIDERFGGAQISRSDPYERAVERWMISREGQFGMAGYLYVLNRDKDRSEELKDTLLGHYRWLSDFLDFHNPNGTFLFEEFGMADLVFTTLMMRFWFLDYYEGFALPQTREYERARRWQSACVSHPAAQQVSYEEIVKLYYDYAIGAGNGALPDGRERSSFVFEPHWRDRPMPPRDKYARIASDAELGLI